MNRFRAFTLAEILMALMIIGVIAAFMMNSFQKINTEEKTDLLSAHKILSVLEEATNKIVNLNTTVCPMGAFMMNDVYIAGMADANAVLNTYAEEIKFQETGFLLKDKTNTLTPVGIDSTTANAIYGARVAASDIYLGFIKYSSIKDCPNVFLPGASASSTPMEFDGTKTQCWGQVVIDVNGRKGNGVLGEDLFTYGLGKAGIVK